MEYNPASENTRRLLFVEDEEVWRELLCAQFRKVAPEWTIVSVCEGREAMDRLGEMDSLQALVTDLHMPRMGGLELIKWVRTQPRYRALPVFVVSSSDNPADHRRCAELGVQKFVSKSNSLERLRNDIHDILHSIAQPRVHLQPENGGSFA